MEPPESFHGLTFNGAFGPLVFVVKLRKEILRGLGTRTSPFTAFLLLQGLETLSTNGLALTR